MAPQTRVPSRALIHALRGILFTTSCSVILLAEERRRRLKLARTALENARKLHTAKTRRRSVQLIEDRGPFDFVDQFAITTGTKHSLDRKSRGKNERSELKSLEGLVSSSTKLPDTSAITKTHTSLAAFGQEFLNLGALRAISEPAYPPIPSATWKPPTAISSSGTSHDKNTGSRRKAVTKQAVASVPVVKQEPSSKPDPAATALGEVEEGMANARSLSENTDPFAVADQPDINNRQSTSMHAKEASDVNEIEVVDGLSDMPSSQPAISEAVQQPAVYDDEKLGALLEKLASPTCTPIEASEAIASALAMLKKLKKGMLIPKKLLKRSPQLIQAVVKHEPTKLKAVLTTLLSHCKDTLRLLMPMVVDIVEKNRPDMFVSLIKHVSQQRPVEFTDSSLLRRMLAQLRNKNYCFEKQERLFEMIKRAGFFHGTLAERAHEFAARRDILLAATEAGDIPFAEAELQELLKLDAELVESDIKLQSRTVRNKAQSGEWDTVFVEVARLAKFASYQKNQLQELLCSLTETFAEQRSLDEVEMLLRQFAHLYHMKMDRRWTLYVMERYGSRCDVEGVCSWLRFCVDNGLELDDVFLDSFYRSCHRSWNFSSAGLRLLDGSLRAAVPTIPSSWRGWRPGQPFSEKSEQTSRVSSAVNGGKHMSEPASDAAVWPTALKRMREHMRAEEWEQAWRIYDETRAAGAEFSSASFRLAIQSRIKMDGGKTDAATALVQQAMKEGLEVSQAMKDLMLGKLAEGADVQELLNESLRLSIRVHDDVYNKAAQTLLGKGDLGAAERVCNLAARENGQQDLLYNKHNFANLLFIYSVHTRYDELESMVHSFTSNRQSWHGSPRCKEGVKHAMKIVASRAVTQPRKRALHERALEMLDGAFMHVKQSIVTAEDRKQLQETLKSMVLSVSKPQRTQSSHKDESLEEDQGAINGNESQENRCEGTLLNVQNELSGEAIAC